MQERERFARMTDNSILQAMPDIFFNHGVVGLQVDRTHARAEIIDQVAALLRFLCVRMPAMEEEQEQDQRDLSHGRNRTPTRRGRRESI